jgi:hypothetical protein
MIPKSVRDSRDGQHRTPFTTILETLVASTVGCIAAVLVDEEGETVDYAGELTPYDMKLAGAHFQIVLRDLCVRAQDGRPANATARCIVTRAERFGYVVRELFGGYVLVVVCAPTQVFSLSPRALRQVEVELSSEAGFPATEDHVPGWARVRVILSRTGEPAELQHLGGRSDRVEVQRIEQAREFERAYQVRTADGRELMLVREPSGVWYAALAD